MPKPKLDVPDPRTGWTPLATAVINGDVDEVRRLLKKGARANAPSTRGETPLLLAAWKSQKERPLIVQLLLQELDLPKNPQLVDETCDAANRKTPLMYAIEQAANNTKYSADLDVIRLLCIAQASLSIKNMDGFTAMQVANNTVSEKRRKAILRALDPEEEKSSLGKLTSVVLSFLLFIVGWVGKAFKGFFRRASGMATKLDPRTNEVSDNGTRR